MDNKKKHNHNYRKDRKRRRSKSKSLKHQPNRNLNRRRSDDREKDIPETTNLINFSFYNNKKEFEILLMHHTSNIKNRLIENCADFWQFVNKYETMLKHSGNPVLQDPLTKILPNESTDRVTNIYHKSLYTTVNIHFDNNRHNRFFSKILTPYKIGQFYEIVSLYIDFKQKEKFQKLKKLRESQNSLPVHQFKDKLRDCINNHQVVVIAGDTGCGKSTQIPQYLHEFGFKSIACTQPRRLACISLCKRVAHEMLQSYTTLVGYQIRFERSKSLKTEISFITEGLLLRQFGLNANLDNYDCIILDEIHERNLYGDFLLGVTKCLLKARPNLKLILMSATININLFVKYFADEDISLIEVPGRLYPIKVIYQPPKILKQQEKEISKGYECKYNPEFSKNASGKSDKKDEKLNPEPFIQILGAIDKKYPRTEKGDVLIFVSGVHEIDIIIEAGKSYDSSDEKWIFLPLHSGLSLEEQDKVFEIAPEGIRKCIVSTNIAETSLTLAGVRFVIDSGKVKEMNFDPQTKTQRLKEFLISKSSADQRKGRAGRTGPGVCYRLYSEKDYEDFEDYPLPEIQRVPLETMVLQMISMGLQNTRMFPFIEPPPDSALEQSILILKQHGAVTASEKLTSVGKALSSLPVELCIGKLLLMGSMIYDIEKVITISSILSIQSIFTNRAFTDHHCKEARGEFESQHGDFFTALNFYREWLEMKTRKLNTRQFCRKMGIEEQRLYEITKLRKQFKSILENSELSLLQKEPENSLSSAERSIRKGEVRILKSLKRSTKYEAIEIERDNKRNKKDYENSEDIRDIDFRLSQNIKDLRKIIESADIRRPKDILLLKLIVTSGFYPNLAIPDEFNYCKSESQHFFHTFSKPFVSIHPNAQLLNNLDAINLTANEIINEKPPYYNQKQPLSAHHKILCYQSLLETTKTYLINPFYLPLAPTLFLFSYSIDTNMGITKIVYDSWICLEFPIPGSGQTFLAKSINLRQKWLNLLSSLLDKSKTIETVWNQLLEDLLMFVDSELVYTVKRLLPADIKNIYNCNFMESNVFGETNPFSSDFEINSNVVKGGLNVTDHVTFGCLKEDPWTIDMDNEMENHNWTCGECGQIVSLCGVFKLIHQNECSKLKLENN